MCIATKKIICNKDYDYVLGLGVLHNSPLIFKTLFAILYNKNLSKYIKNIMNRGILSNVEAGIPNKIFNSMEDTGYGYLRNANTGYKDCIKINFARTIQDANNASYKVRLKNTIILMSTHCTMTGLIFFIFIVHWLYTSLAVIFKKIF